MAPDPYFEIKESFLGDILRNHIELLRIADTKANMLLIASSIVLTLSLQFILKDGPLFLGFTIIVFSTLASSLLALLAIIPREHSPEGINLMYYRSFLRMKEDEYVEALKNSITNKDFIIEEYARDIYKLGEKTLYKKYRYLEFALMVFLSGFLLASVVTIFSTI